MAPERLHAAVVCAGESGINALATVRALGRRGVPVRVVGRAGNARLASRSRYCTQFREAPASRLYETLCALGAERPVLFIDNDPMLRELAPHAENLARLFSLVDPLADAIRLTDKQFQVTAAQAAGVLVPGSWLPRTDADVVAIEAPCRLIAKPLPTASPVAPGFKVLVAADGRELARMLAAHRAHPSSVIVQQFVEGNDENIYATYCYRSPSGAHTDVLTVRKLRQYPKGAGVMAVGEVCDEPELRELTVRLAESLSYSGVLSVEFKRDRQGRFWFIEWNPRLGGFHALGWQAGFDCAYAAYLDRAYGADASRQKRAPIRYDARHVWINLGCELALVLEQRRLPLGAAMWGPYLRKKEWAVHASDDLLPWVAACGHTAGWLLARLVRRLPGAVRPGCRASGGERERHVAPHHGASA